MEMKRRGFLKTLAGLCGVAVAPSIPAVPAVARIEQTHILPMPVNTPLVPWKDLSETALEDMVEQFRTKYEHVEYGYKAVLRDGSYRFEKVG